MSGESAGCGRGGRSTTLSRVIIRTVKSSTGRRRRGAAAGASGQVRVLASTNVWGDVAAQIGGEHVAVTSIISDPSADPHSFQSSARNQLALSKAALIIENGGGYDDFMQTMLASAASSAPVINAVNVSGLAPTDGELNEHVWYDFPTVTKV